MEEAHEALQTRIVKAGWAAVVLLAGASCFLLERHWNAATSPMFKTPIYMILGAALSFTVSQQGKKSRLDRQAGARLLEAPSRLGMAAHWAPGRSYCRLGPAVQLERLAEVPPKALVSLRLTVQVSISLVDLIHMGATCCVRVTPNCAPPQMDSPAQMVAGFAGAVAMGAMFGVIFGLMNVMQDAPGQMERQRSETVP